MFIQATKYLNPEDLFQGDLDDNLNKVVLVLEIIDYIQMLFEEFRNNIENYFKTPAKPVQWAFHEKLIFNRLYKYEMRLKQIQVYSLK